MTTFAAPRLLIGSTLTGPGAIAVEDGRIVEVLDGLPAPGADRIVLEHGILTAGMIDLQFNGAFGVEMVSASMEEWNAVSRALAGHGVTSFQPTFVTARVADLTAALQSTTSFRQAVDSAGGARMVGVHLEGPMISRPGAHDPNLIQLPSVELARKLVEAAPGLVTMVTLAPELPGALDVIRWLRHQGVVISIGHSNAMAIEAQKAADAGATAVTHIFNAQRPFTHREPGIAGQALYDPRLVSGLIADLVHVAPQVCVTVMRAAPGRVALITDSATPAGMPPGHYRVGGREVEVDEVGGTPHLADGTLAGSVLMLDRAVRNVVGLGCGLTEVLLAVTRVPAEVLGRNDLGRLEVGAPADLVWWSDDLVPLRTWVGGTQAYDSKWEAVPE